MTDYVYDQLDDAYRRWEEYPENILRQSRPERVLKGYRKRLKDESGRLFKESQPQLVFWEAWRAEGKFQLKAIRAPKILDDHLYPDTKDPGCRHVFIEANNSRAPLNCSLRMLQSLFTFQQVEPSFLDYLHTFGDQEEPIDACLCHFQSDDSLGSSALAIPTLGRSGSSMRLSYLLRAPEHVPEAEWKWSIRQAAVYLSFDIKTGRTLWITIKGNNLLREHICEEAPNLEPSPSRSSGSDDKNGGDINDAFEATLKTHLVYFRWCEENWRWLVRDVEDAVRRISTKAKTAPIGRVPHFEPFRPEQQHSQQWALYSRRHQFTQPSVNDAFNLDPGNQPSQAERFLPPQKQSTMSSVLSLLKREPPSLSSENSPPNKMKAKPPGKMLVLEMFNLSDLQKLNVIAERVEEAILTIKLDVGVIQDCRAYYGSMPCSNLAPGPDSFAQRTGTFFRQLQYLVRSLETRQTQLESLLRRLDEGKKLLESILQYRNLQVSQIFAEKAQMSAKNTELIAANETSSMHIITVVTLVFLPGTFVSTFFGSGVLQWNDGISIDSTWQFRGDAFALFVEVCVPLMVGIALIWLLVHWNIERKARLELQEAIRMKESHVP
ncbi:uncharacterized protein BCR38DRAFT_451443 [Pseudomassariella vexata]|uniref:CorA-like transporter domain-containing protein n=1 Tax=Pseudomassariella vexata TaxID=1141098 RepID=A0A1Y2DA70_9PEZI|nr:uncharacterized protein BCR38DRAFT_451443 [Pseudomassariella vexata]ORY56097.1 hypothetical protein BCR38DRAFT_451443 [Pseudomassariella vexata]